MMYVTGDTHGYYTLHKLSHRRWREGRNLTRHDTVCVLGDFGLLWNSMPDASEHYWLDWLHQKPWTTVFVDGNHENHELLAALPQVEFRGGTAGQVGENLFHLRRGEIYEIDGKKIFTFGGATSVDRESRLQGISWWPQEVCCCAEIEHALSNLERHQYAVDIVLAHTAPRTVINIMKGGDDYLAKILNCPTSNFLEHVCSSVRFDAFYCGHFHVDWVCGKYNLLYDKIVKIA